MAEKGELGSSSLSVTAVGLGCTGFSHAYGAPTERSEAVKMLRKKAVYNSYTQKPQGRKTS